MALALAAPYSKASRAANPLKNVTGFVKRVRHVLKKKVISIWNAIARPCVHAQSLCCWLHTQAWLCCTYHVLCVPLQEPILGIKVSEVFLGGSLGQETSLPEHFDVDLVVYSPSAPHTHTHTHTHTACAHIRVTVHVRTDINIILGAITPVLTVQLRYFYDFLKPQSVLFQMAR